MSPSPSSIQIIKIDGSRFVFDYDAFNYIINKNNKCKDLPVGVIIINGPLRTGKSFFTNFIIRHLKNNNIEQSNYFVDYFVSRRGTDIQTLGIWALDEIFIYNDMAIVLMDTQGIFDLELNQAMTIALISLSTIMSSYQIYNLDKRIQEDHLCNMAYFSAYSSLISNTNNCKIGQTLCLLVRDWANFENNYDLNRCDIETEKYKNDFLGITKNMDVVKKETRKKISDTYDNVVVRLCPHPGYLVTEGKFSGKLSEIREDFIIHVDHIINKILQDLKPKRIGTGQVLLCRELPNYLKEYVTLYENVKESLPEAMTILETTEKICQDNARTKTVHFYKEKMLSQLRIKRMTKEDIEAWNKSCSRDANKYFKKLYIMGSPESIQNVKKNIMNDIENEYQQFLLMARDKNIFNFIYDNIMNMINYILNGNILTEFFVKNIMFLLIIMYIFTAFLPFGSEIIASVIRYSFCIFVGIHLSFYVRDNQIEHKQRA